MRKEPRLCNLESLEFFLLYCGGELCNSSMRARFKAVVPRLCPLAAVIGRLKNVLLLSLRFVFLEVGHGMYIVMHLE